MFMRLGLVGVTAGMLALGLIACGEGGAIGPPCSDGDCRTGEICHPEAHQCVQTCDSGADCPDSAKTCDELSATDTRKICKCVTDQLCDRDAPTGSSAICSTEFRICMTKCGSDSDCPTGTACETSTGQCLSMCNPSSTTLGAHGGPDTCNYGDFCSSSGSCTAAPEGTCGEATGSGAPTWNKTLKQAPVITSATAVLKNPTNVSGECANRDPAGVVTIRYYAPNGLTTHSDFLDLQNHVKFRNVTSGQFFEANFPVQNPTPDARFGEFQVGIGCGNVTETAALFIADESGNTSNVVCVSW